MKTVITSFFAESGHIGTSCNGFCLFDERILAVVMVMVVVPVVAVAVVMLAIVLIVAVAAAAVMVVAMLVTMAAVIVVSTMMVPVMGTLIAVMDFLVPLMNRLAEVFMLRLLLTTILTLNFFFLLSLYRLVKRAVSREISDVPAASLGQRCNALATVAVPIIDDGNLHCRRVNQRPTTGQA